MLLSIYLFLILQLMIVSYVDIKIKKISNYWVLFNILIFTLFIFLFPGHYQFIFKTFILSFSLLVVGFVLFKLKIMGAGDSKYLSSFYLLIPLALQKEVLVYCLYSIMVAGCLILVFNTIRNFDKIIRAVKQSNMREITGIYGSKIPLIPVVFLSWMWFGIDFWEKMV